MTHGYADMKMKENDEMLRILAEIKEDTMFLSLGIASVAAIGVFLPFILVMMGA